jgi:uncharacterized repeat protein (TIGR03803 family)
VLHSFGGIDGAAPDYGLVADKAGSFYGATLFGGKIGAGAIFKLTPGKSGYSEKVLHSFSGGSDGNHPQGVVVDQNGALYGGTLTGGNNNCPFGCGTVFKLTPGKSGYTFTLLRSFSGGTDAAQTVGALVLDSKGAVYGATQFGGISNNGAVFKLTPTKTGYRESVLYSFPGGAGGALPQAGLTIDKHGNLFGTTYNGGNVNCGCGTVFKLTPGKSGYTAIVLYRFGGSDGFNPFAALTVDESSGAIFGTTQYGGSNFDGVVFKLTPSGIGYVESVLHSFNAGGDGNPDGAIPKAQLLLRPNGNLYGTTSIGGSGCNGIGCGSVFQLTPSGSGYSFNYIYNFRRPINGADPEVSGLIADAKGALYGETRSGGTKTSCYDGGPGGALGCGTVFKLVVP